MNSSLSKCSNDATGLSRSKPHHRRNRHTPNALATSHSAVPLLDPRQWFFHASAPPIRAITYVRVSGIGYEGGREWGNLRALIV
jgi:hypothetical protein